MKYFTVGITGPTGAGKSTVSAAFLAKGFAVVDCDKLSRKAVEPGGAALNMLCEYFGGDIISPKGELDRSLLAQRAFSSEQGRKKLNAAVHPAVIELTKQETAKAHKNGQHVLIDAPLLFEAGVDKLCDICVAVVASPEQRLGRICSRDSISREAALLRMSAQQPESFYTQKCSFVIENNGSEQELAPKAAELVQKIIEKIGGDLQ